MGKSGRLSELHDSYVWEVNAAVGQGRLDLVWQLADQFVDEAWELLAEDEEASCGRADCVVCHRPRPPALAPGRSDSRRGTRRRWRPWRARRG